MAYIDPSFANIDDKELAVAFTNWLYGDANGNPNSWDKPELWPNGPRVKFVKRRITAVIANGGDDNEQTTNLWGGKNSVVFSRSATVRLTTPPANALRLPNEHAEYVTFKQLSGDGQFNVEENPIATIFGTIPGQPLVLDPPQMWWGNATKTYTIGNDIAASVTVHLTWMAAVLATGR